MTVSHQNQSQIVRFWFVCFVRLLIVTMLKLKICVVTVPTKTEQFSNFIFPEFNEKANQNHETNPTSPKHKNLQTPRPSPPQAKNRIQSR